MRDFCPLCAMKHLGQARAQLLETRKGYPFHVWNAMGHMGEAEDEIVMRMPEEAEVIRAERLKLQDDFKYVPDWEMLMLKVALGAGLVEVPINE